MITWTNRGINNWSRYLISVTFLVGPALIFTNFVASIVVVRGDSMLPTLRSGEVALVPRQETWLNRLGYGGVKAGDIVFFRSPLERNKHFIKRIIATSGERIRIVEGIVYLNGRLVREPYLGSIIVPTNLPETEIAPGNVFVLGDNRRPLGSLDSRHFGQIPFDSIGGRVAIILWPPFVIIDKRLRRNFRVLN